jgi:hypothetical protein
MSPFPKQQAVAAHREHEALRSRYREELRRLADERALAQSRAEGAISEIAGLVAGAQQAGVSVVEVSELTGISRPTLYRMLADTRQRADLRSVVVAFEEALPRLTRELGHTILPYELGASFGTSTDEVLEQLMQIYPLLAEEVGSLGPSALTTLSSLLPDLQNPEDTVLRMLMLQGVSKQRVAWSTQRSERDVLGLAALGLLRVIPQMRAPQTSQE